MSHTAFAGNIVTDVQTRKTRDGKPVAAFRVAEDRSYLGAGGQRVQQPANFHDVVVFGAKAEHLLESLGRGDEVVVVGEITTDEWVTDAGEKRSRQVIKARHVGAGLTFRPVHPMRGAPRQADQIENPTSPNLTQTGADGWPIDGQ